jgi:hypothetical protein
MKHASFPTVIDSTIEVTARKPSTRWSPFQWLLETLHHSRRLQAQRVLRQYRHLIARRETADAKSKVTADTLDRG